MNLSSFRQNRWLRRLVWLVAGVLVLWALGWLVAAPLMRSVGEKWATQKLGRQVSIGKVDFRPWSLELTIQDLAIASASGDVPQVQIQRIYMNAALQSLWRLAPVVDALQVDAPVVRLKRLASGSYDIDDVLARLTTTEPAPQGGPAGFALYNIAVQGGAMDFQDDAVGRSHTLRALSLKLPFVSSLPSQRDIKVLPHLAFQLNGDVFESQAEATPFAATPQANASIHLADFDLSPYLGYLPESLPVRLQSAVLDADVQVSFVQAPVAALKLQGRVQAKEVKVLDTAQRALLSWDTLQVDVADLQPLERRMRLSAVQLQSPRLSAHRARDGRLNLALSGPPDLKKKTAPEPAGRAPAAIKKEAPADWQVAVECVAVRGAQVDWLDESLPAPARVALRELALDASAIALPLTQPLRFAGRTQVSGAGVEAAPAPARLVFEGHATPQRAQVALELHDVPLALAAPYGAQWVAPRLAGTLNADLGLAWNAPALVAQVARLTLDGIELACAPATDCTPTEAASLPLRGKSSLAELKKLQIDNAQIHLTQRSATVGRIALTQPRVLVERTADGHWMYERWLAPVPPSTAQAVGEPQQPGATSTASTSRPAAHTPVAVPTPAPPWSVQLAEVAVDAGTVAFRDGAQAQPVAFLLSSLQLRLQDFAPLAASAKPSALSVSARIGAGRTDPGRLEYDGTLGLAPLAAQGRVLASQVPLHAFEPYVADALNVDIRRADGSFKGEVRYAAASAGPELKVQGDAALDDVRVRMLRAPSDAPSIALGGGRGAGAQNDLLNWKSLSLRGLQVALAPGKPPTVDVQETTLSDFFARIIIQESGRLNLQDLVKGAAPTAAGAASAVATGKPTPQTTAIATETAGAVAGVAPVAQAAPVPDPLAPVIRVGPVSLTGGKVYFTDHFIRPNYSANLSELAGRLSAFSSLPPAGGGAPDMADLELRGRAEGTASLEITGKLNPLVQPLALDIRGRMRDLELPPLSPYTIKYAGHGVERGKLSMDVSYRVQPDGQLTASNKLVLNQLTFGEPVPGAPASLPVRLAVALLADRNGVIDVDLPISGSLNDPEFRLGTVIFKVIGNLILKAVTAPFSLLASALGGSDALDSVAFAPGSAQLDEGARQGLEKIAQAMLERPALKMTVVGQASADTESDAWRRERLQEALLAQKRRLALRAGQSAEGIVTIEPQEYVPLLKEVYRRADVTKRRNLVGMAKDVPQAEMEALLLAHTAVPENAMQDLALARAVAVRDHLAARGLPLERLFLGAAKSVGAEPDWKPHAQLVLATR